MLGAIVVAFIPFQKASRNPAAKTVFDEPIQLPTNQKIDSRLVTGSLLFGVGWGIAGICLAPSLTLKAVPRLYLIRFKSYISYRTPPGYFYIMTICQNIASTLSVKLIFRPRSSTISTFTLVRPKLILLKCASSGMPN